VLFHCSAPRQPLGSSQRSRPPQVPRLPRVIGAEPLASRVSSPPSLTFMFGRHVPQLTAPCSFPSSFLPTILRLQFFPLLRCVTSAAFSLKRTKRRPGVRTRSLRVAVCGPRYLRTPPYVHKAPATNWDQILRPVSLPAQAFFRRFWQVLPGQRVSPRFSKSAPLVSLQRLDCPASAEASAPLPVHGFLMGEFSPTTRP